MKNFYQIPMRRALAVLTVGLALGGIFGTTSRAADMYRMGSLNSGGGIPAESVITSLTQTSSNATINWYGLEGWYSIEASTSPTGPWSSVASVAATDYAWSKTVANPDPTNSYFFRLNQANAFAGSGNCGSCHGDKFAEWSKTPHATALNTIAAIGMNNNASCLPCHTVGFGQQTGYTNFTVTPHLANVGCENCHGAAGWHKDSDHSLIRPVVSMDPEICGSCHQGSHHPTYEEYELSPHAEVLDDINYGFANGVYHTNTIVRGGKTLYGYYVTVSPTNSLVLVTNATTGIINSSHVPGSAIDPGYDRATSCGVCHSAASRMAMLNDYEDRLAGGSVKPMALPAAVDGGAWGAACVTCHDPHSYARTNQLRNPMYSTNFYTMPSLSDKTTSYTTNYQGVITTNVNYYNTTFASLYNPNINVCGQCHNHRGARWDGLAYGVLTTNVVSGLTTNVVYVDIYATNTVTQVFTNELGAPYLTNSYTYTYVSGRTNTTVVTTTTNAVRYTGVTTNVTGYSRPPHHSPQYNILIGNVQENYLPVATHNHTRISTQCAACHMASYPVSSTTNVTGHTFELNVKGCALAGCHTSYTEEGLMVKIEEVQVAQSNSIARVVSMLNQWATNQAPAILGATDYNKSKQNSWEFTTPGQLAGITNAGPAATNQVKLPTAIRQARFDLYMAAHDGSLGVHNPTYVKNLLNHAETNVASQFSLANFSAKTVQGAAPLSVVFTNVAGLSSWDWNFGDGGTSTSANPTYIYTNPGLYSVTFTANGTETLTRTAYIKVAAKPTVSFTADTTTVPVNVPVTFTNDSSNISDVGLWRMQFNTASSSTRVDSGFVPTYTYTYTNAGTYSVSLRASYGGTTTTTTKTNYIVVTP